MVGHGFHGVHHLRGHLLVNHARRLTPGLLLFGMSLGIADRLDDALRLLNTLIGDHGNRIRQLKRIGRVSLAEQHGVLGSQIPLIGRI